MKTSKIPDFPKIEINNYISKLSGNIRVILNEKTLNSLITESILMDISKKLNYKVASLKKYIRKNQYPLFFIKILNNLKSDDIFRLIEKNDPIFFSKWKRIKLPNKLTPKLAYFIGYLQGDGSIESNGKRINFSDEYFEQIKIIDCLCFELFGTHGRIETKKYPLSKKSLYRLEIGSYVLNSYLNRIFGINRGIKKDLKIPPIFYKNKEILKWYLTGLYDADGTLPKEPAKAKQLFIDVTFKDREFINQVKEALNLFGIKTLKPYCRIAKSPHSNYISKTWELRIRKRADIIKFLKLIGFSHPDKHNRVKKTLKYLRQ